MKIVDNTRGILIGGGMLDYVHTPIVTHNMLTDADVVITEYSAVCSIAKEYFNKSVIYIDGSRHARQPVDCEHASEFNDNSVYEIYYNDILSYKCQTWEIVTICIINLISNLKNKLLTNLHNENLKQEILDLKNKNYNLDHKNNSLLRLLDEEKAKVAKLISQIDRIRELID